MNYSGDTNINGGAIQSTTIPAAGTVYLQPGTMFWLNATTTNTGLGISYYGTCVGQGTMAVTAFNQGTAGTSIGTDLGGYDGLVDLRANPTSGQGGVDMTTPPPGANTTIKIAQGVSLRLNGAAT